MNLFRHPVTLTIKQQTLPQMDHAYFLHCRHGFVLFQTKWKMPWDHLGRAFHLWFFCIVPQRELYNVSWHLIPLTFLVQNRSPFTYPICARVFPQVGCYNTQSATIHIEEIFKFPYVLRDFSLKAAARDELGGDFQFSPFESICFYGIPTALRSLPVLIGGVKSMKIISFHTLPYRVVLVKISLPSV